MIREPRDKFEVDTPHGLGIVLYVHIQGAPANDIWCVANIQTGEIRHYQTVQLKLGANHTLGINSKSQGSRT